ncbi:hypothetical protein FOL47_010327 [Perkinsus chesapeaki]|uniref:Uncharacterized protein n=1 Tax=Perkinsus chesapeaki TaxID=330153 RepID=A0A7J6L286_PERCH|nr:hypothetical protein FOL47_010327 [Perkinsus chesapeaki]
MVMVVYGFILLSSYMAELVQRWRILVVLASGVMMTLLAILACVATKRRSNWCIICTFFTVCMMLLALYVSGAISATIEYAKWVSMHSEVGHSLHYAPNEWTPEQRGAVVEMRGTFFEMWGDSCTGGKCTDDGKCLESPVKLTEVVCEGESSLGKAFTRWQDGAEHASRTAVQPYFTECKNSTMLTEPYANEEQVNSWCVSFDTLLYRTQNWNFYNMFLMWALTVVMITALGLNAIYLFHRRRAIQEEKKEVLYVSRRVSGSNWWLTPTAPGGGSVSQPV